MPLKKPPPRSPYFCKSRTRSTPGIENPSPAIQFMAMGSSSSHLRFCAESEHCVTELKQSDGPLPSDLLPEGERKKRRLGRGLWGRRAPHCVMEDEDLEVLGDSVSNTGQYVPAIFSARQTLCGFRADPSRTSAGESACARLAQ